MKYKHYKGGIYTVITHVAKHSETEEMMVVYKDKEEQIWVRPHFIFFEDVEWPDGEYRPRFVPVGEE